MRYDDAIERTKRLIVQMHFPPQNMKVTKSYDGKRDDTKGPGYGRLVISDFPSSSYAKYYSTKQKSVKNASDSSTKLISYSSIFASIFR